MIQVGSKVNDYEVVARLRSGGMAALYLGRRVGAAGFSRPVAIKVIHPHLSEDKNFVTMFLDEAKLSARITHPNVVHVEELGQRGTFYYLVMEYVHGCSLSQLVRALRGRGRRLTPELATYVAIQTADGLHAAHETVGDDGELLGVVHRDISPQNVLLSYRGHTKLIDFGVAKARGRTQHTTVSSLKGKLRYMAPEQASSQPVDRRTDVYALGIVLWELLTMRTLFKAENDLKLHDLVKNPVVEPPSKFVEGIPPELDAVVMRALARDPNDRPASAQEFRRMLANALPAALAVESEQLAELLCVVMADTIRDQHRRLPETISKALKREVGDALDREPGAEDPRELELLGTLTTSASHLIGTDGSTVESRGSQSVSMAQAEPMPQAPWQSQAVEPELDHEAPPRAKWVRWVAVVAVLAMIGVVAALFGGGDPQAVTPRGTETRSATEGSVPAATSPSTASSGAAAVAPTEAAPAVESPTPAPAEPENPAPAASSGRNRATPTRRSPGTRASASASEEPEPSPSAAKPVVDSLDILQDDSQLKRVTKPKKASRATADDLLLDDSP